MEAVKDRLTDFYVEQLVQREKPSNRSAESWQKILATAREGFEAHLSTLNSVQQVLAFGERCLKDTDLKEAFRHFALEDSHRAAIAWETQVRSLHPEQECERSLEAASTSVRSDPCVFRQSFAHTAACLDLDPEPNQVVFSSLRPLEGASAIDLLSDCESDVSVTVRRSA